MDRLVEKVANLAYEIVGVMMPGLTGVAMLSAILATWLLGVETIGWHQMADLYRVLRADPWVSLSGVIVLSYFVGHFLLWFSKEGWSGFTGRVRRAGEPATKEPRPSKPAHRFLLLIGAARSKTDVNESLASLRDSSAKWLAGADEMIAKRATADWRVFYLLATKAIAQARASSLMDTYRNKYTLHRSLATAAAMGFWASSLGLVVALIFLRLRLRLVAALGLEAIIFLVFVFFFAASFKSYWDLLAETVVAESFVLRRMKKEEQ